MAGLVALGVAVGAKRRPTTLRSLAVAAAAATVEVVGPQAVQEVGAAERAAGLAALARAGLVAQVWVMDTGVGAERVTLPAARGRLQTRLPIFPAEKRPRLKAVCR